MRDGYTRSESGSALAPQTVTASVASGETIDMRGKQSVALIFHLGAFSYTGTNKVGLGIKTKALSGDSWTTVNSSGDTVSASDTIASGIFTEVTTTVGSAGATYRISYTGGLNAGQRYITPFLTIGGTVSAIIGCTYEFETSLKAPVNT